METKTRGEGSKQRRTGIFISHSRKDKDFVRRIEEALEERGYDAWVDVEDILPTEDWLAKVYLAIEGTDAFVR
jgi:hypothetical protein